MYGKLIITKQIAEQASRIDQQNEKRDEKQAQNVIKINQNDPNPRSIPKRFHSKITRLKNPQETCSQTNII